MCGTFSHGSVSLFCVITITGFCRFIFIMEFCLRVRQTRIFQVCSCCFHYLKSPFISSLDVVWDVGRGDPRRITTMQGHSNWVRCIRSYKDYIISASADGFFRIWKANNSFECVCECDAQSGRLYGMTLSDHVCFLLQR